MFARDNKLLSILHMFAKRARTRTYVRCSEYSRLGKTYNGERGLGEDYKYAKSSGERELSLSRSLDRKDKHDDEDERIARILSSRFESQEKRR